MSAKLDGGIKCHCPESGNDPDSAAYEKPLAQISLTLETLTTVSGPANPGQNAKKVPSMLSGGEPSSECISVTMVR